MSGINIPGVTDKYNTNETVEKLMKVERIPLTREQDTLKTYQTQQAAWRDLNKKMTDLRDSVKTLYSYDNPFNNKLASSSDEFAVTAQAGRNASFDSFKLDVVQPATADRFLTADLPEDYKVPQGTYTFKVADKTVTMNWKGGSLSDFSTALNKRGNDIIKSMVIGADTGKKSLLIESLKTGSANRLVFEGDARKFAFDSGMISPVKDESGTLGTKTADFMPAPAQNSSSEQTRLPPLTNKTVQITGGNTVIPPRTAFQLAVPAKISGDSKQRITFTIDKKTTDDITDALNKQPAQPLLPDAGSASFKDVTIKNNPSDTTLPPPSAPPEPLKPEQSSSVVYALMNDGTEKEIATPDILTNDKTSVSIDVKDYQGISGIIIRNRNTGVTFTMTPVTAANPDTDLGYSPNHAVAQAGDAIIKYEGITIKRPTNKIDDVVPDITLELHEKTEKTATITVKPDVESSKQALITFVGKYNQTVAEINILSQNKPEIVSELTYLSDDEKKAEDEKLGMFLSDFTLTSAKSNMQTTVSNRYKFTDSADITMLSQVGIATNASGSSTGYSQSKLRGYLEIDEKKLDNQLSQNIDQIRNLFGYDTDGDLIIDSGIGIQLDKQLTAYVQSGGVLASRTNSLDGRIKDSEQKIAKLETQLDKKEAQLRQQYGQMEGTLNSLETQQTTINNFSKQQNGQQ